MRNPHPAARILIPRPRFRLGLSFLACAVVFWGCSVFTAERSPRETPEQAFARLNDALQSGDWAALYASAASPGTQKLFDEDFEKVKDDLVKNGGAPMFARSVLGVSTDEYLAMSAKDFFIRMSEAAGRPANLLVRIPDAERLRNARVVDTKIEGDEALLFVEVEGESFPMELFRENGRWYFQLLDLD